MSHLSELNFYSAEIGTNIMSLVMTLQVAGLHRVRPSATLDKSSIFYFFCKYRESFSALSRGVPLTNILPTFLVV